MSVTNKFSLPLLVILWLGVCLFLIGYTYVLYDRYTEEFHHAKETLVNSKRFYDGVCQNATNREIYHSVSNFNSKFVSCITRWTLEQIRSAMT